ncbi:MAG: NAD(P)H-dependent oxidoreductase [Acidobacteriota bacterium]
MRLAIFNGSPRGDKSNTTILLSHFLTGFEQTAGHTHEIHYLRRVKHQDEFVKAFAANDCVLIAYPLYADSMPGQVKLFIESLQPLCGREGNPALAFMVQSGFPEAIHSRYVEKYHEKLARRLGARYLGTIIKGGVEGISVQPPFMTNKLFNSFYQIGQVFGKTGQLEKSLLNKLAGPDRMSAFKLFVYRAMMFPLARLTFWDKMLKENGAYDKRFAQPFSDHRPKLIKE